MTRSVPATAVALALSTGALAAPASGQVSHEAWSPGSSSIAEPEVIPPAYRGRWAPNRAACADQDGVDRWEISSSGIDTYESGGRLQRVTQSGQDRSIRLKLAFEGEGEFWETIQVWSLNATGDRLSVSEDGQRKVATLIRCDP